jgi:A/G-specific adenine glycosylase
MSTISKKLIHWYSEHKRDLPWRVTSDPYLIWLSEIILQQTRVNQGMDYYLRFSGNYPTVHHLAKAPLDEVLKLWQGLGYYSRARNLHETAKRVVSEYNGVFPDSYTQLISLKGIGPYTAAAIASFSSGEPKAVVDGNVFRVLSRLFNEHTPINTTKGQKIFSSLAKEILPLDKPGEHNQAIMEFGALQCTPKKPACLLCPLSDHCMALSEGTVMELPKKEGKTKVKDRYLYYLIENVKGKIAVEQRNDQGIWKGLFQFRLIELHESNALEKAIAQAQIPALSEITHISEEVKHILSHQRLHVRFIHVNHPEIPMNAEKNVRWVTESEFHKLAIPRLIDKYLEKADSIFRMPDEIG